MLALVLISLLLNILTIAALVRGYMRYENFFKSHHEAIDNCWSDIQTTEVKRAELEAKTYTALRQIQENHNMAIDLFYRVYDTGTQTGALVRENLNNLRSKEEY